jgi:hypothetical protein
MGLELVRLVSQLAGAIAVLALVGCFIAATAAVELTRSMVETAADAFRLARLMALVGGAAVVVAGLAATLYWWSAGVASSAAASGTAMGIGLAGVGFAVVVRRVWERA